MKPTETGWYWLKYAYGPVEIVFVNMHDHWYRKKRAVVYHLTFREPLDNYLDNFKWSERLVDPFKEKDTFDVGPYSNILGED